MRKGSLGGFLVGVAIFGGIILGITCIERVPAGYCGGSL